MARLSALSVMYVLLTGIFIAAMIGIALSNYNFQQQSLDVLNTTRTELIQRAEEHENQTAIIIASQTEKND